LPAWEIEYRSGSRELTEQSNTRENALRRACDRMIKGDTVERVTGPGEVIEQPEIQQYRQKLLAAGALR
jgi:hypothetical protein